MLSSCIMENSQCPPDGKVVISFSFSTQDNMTRAGHTWGDNLDNNPDNNYDVSVGEDYDTRIKVKSLRAFIYDNQNNYICEIVNKTYFELDVDGSNAIEPNGYKFLGELELTPEIYSSLKDKECKIMLVANHTLPSEYTDYANTTFSVNDIAFPNGFIPMWGITTKTLTLEPQQDLGTIYLLRSAAKVEVELSDNLVRDGYTIQSVAINKYAANGFWFPNGWNQVENTINLYHLSQEGQVGSYNPYASIEFATNKSFTNNSASTSSVVYLPEMNTNGVAMTVVLSKGSSTFTFNNAIKFANYDESGSATSTTFNVVRNHHYQYTINKVNVGSNLELTCVVQPWTLVEESWDYTDVPQSNTEGKINWHNYGEGNFNQGRYSGEYVEFGSSYPHAMFKFALTGPKNATWRAEFVTKKGRQNAFKFVSDANNSIPCLNATLSADGFVATGDISAGTTTEFVTLSVNKAFDNNTTGVDDEAYLRISVVLSDGRVINANDVLIPAGTFGTNKDVSNGYIMIHKKM